MQLELPAGRGQVLPADAAKEVPRAGRDGPRRVSVCLGLGQPAVGPKTSRPHMVSIMLHMYLYMHIYI